jgi:hypothetical protein
MFWKTVKYALLLVLIASLAVAVYSWLDTAVSLNHARQQQKTDEETRELLRKFILVSNRGAKRSEIMQVVQQNFAKVHGIQEERDRIIVDNIVFRFDDSQSLTDVQFLDTMSD